MPLFTGLHCLICYKEGSNTGNQQAGSLRTLDKNAEICRRFCTLASRYFDLDPFHFAPAKTINSKRAYLIDRACENCVDFLKSFCDIYQQWESLEMRLRWRAHEIAQVMNLADSEGTNRKTLEEKLKNMDMHTTIEEIDDFRTDFKDTIAGMRKAAYPNLKIKKHQTEDDDFIAVKVKMPKKERRTRESEKVEAINAVNSPSVPAEKKTEVCPSTSSNYRLCSTSSVDEEQQNDSEEESQPLPVRQRLPVKSKRPIAVPVSTTQNVSDDKRYYGHESNPGDNPKNGLSSSSISDSSQSDENTVIDFPLTKNTNDDGPKDSFYHCQDYLLRNRRATNMNCLKTEDTGSTVLEEKPIVYSDGYLKQFSHLEYICPFPHCGLKLKNMTRMKVHQRSTGHHFNAIISILSK